jgi:TolB protein
MILDSNRELELTTVTSMMRLTMPSLVTSAMLFACVGGCASSTTTSTSVSQKTAENDNPRTIETSIDATSLAVFGELETPIKANSALGMQTSPSPRPSTTSRAKTAGGDRYSSLIGLYGELVNEPGDTTSLHGRGNLAQISFAHDGACFDPAISPEGQRVAFSSTMHGPNANIYIKSVTGTSVTQITSGSADHVMPAFSPDGKKIAYASNRDGKWDIYVVPVSGGPAVQLTRDSDHEIHPTFSPDGRQIAYCRFSNKSGRWEIWVTELENPGVKRFLEYGMFPRWSPDIASSKILFQRPTQRGSRLHGVWTVDYVNGEAINPTQVISASNAAVINPTWSPDGRYIAFATVLDPDKTKHARPEQSDIWVIRADGSGRTRLTDGQFANFQPMWSADGRVYFVSNRSGVDNIWAVGTGRLVDLHVPKETDLAGVDTESGRP